MRYLMSLRKPDIEQKQVSELGRTMRVGPDGLTEEIVKGETAIRQWVDVMLRQRPGLTPVYDFVDAPVGVNSVGVSNLPKAVMLAEIQKNVKDTMTLNPCVLGVENFAFTRGRRGLRIEFGLLLNNGQEVNIAYDI